MMIRLPWRSARHGAERVELLPMLERRIRRLAVVSVISTPVLLMIGLGLGRITSQSLTLPEHAPVRLHPSVVVSPAELDTLRPGNPQGQERGE